MFVEKTTSELEALTVEQLDAYKAEMKAHQKTELSNEIKGAVETAQKNLESFLGNEIANQLTEKMTSVNNEEISFGQALKNAIIENKEAIKSLKDSASGSVKLEVNKAVVNMTFGTNTTGRIGRTEVDGSIYGLQRKQPFIGDLISLGTTNARTYVYVDKTGYEGAPAMTAEGVLKPVGDWNLVEKTVNPKKVAFIVTVSKEMLDDIDGMAQDIEQEIREQIIDVMEVQWLTGDGTGDNISGISTNATAFAAGALANTIADANNTDVLRAAVKQVELNNFYPNAIIVSPDDAASMDLQKGTDGHYVLPPFTSADNTSLKGIRVISNNYVAAGTFYVGDFTRYKGKVREGLTIDMGYKDGDWQKNFVSFRGEARFFGYIPTNHFGAIVKGTFSVAKAALDPDVA
jgi:HK97 family phage major capsid protein